MTEKGNSGTGLEKGSDGVNRSATADILALLHGETDAHPAAAYAVGLAETFGAHLTVTGLTRDPARQFYLAQAQAQVLAAAVDAARGAAGAFANKIAKLAGERGVSATPLTREIQIGQGWSEIAQFARLFDIAVLARPAGEEAARDEALLETVLLQVGQGGDRGAAHLCRADLVRAAGRRLGRQPQRGARARGSHADPAPRRRVPRRHRRGAERHDARRPRHRPAYRAARRCLHARTGASVEKRRKDASRIRRARRAAIFW